MSMRLNELTEDIVKSQLTVTEIESLARLCKWLYPDVKHDPIGTHARVAPSIITRSELELFAVAMPRFAYRIYISPKSFVNARRVGTLANQNPQWTDAPAEPIIKIQEKRFQFDSDRASRNAPADLIRRSSCIGDSLLTRRSELAGEEYHVISTELGLAYGEGDEIHGTPYVQHIRLGGGMCAQATAFMATCLCQNWAKSITGVAEISTFAATQPTNANGYIDIGGLSPDELVTYFCHHCVGLEAASERLLLDSSDPTPADQWRRWHALALKSYLLSNIPVVAFVDLGRMFGVGEGLSPANSLLTNNRLPDEILRRQSQFTPGHNQSHCVLLVGCHVNHDEYVINDPATYPFLKAQYSELLAVSRYGDAGILDELHTVAVLPGGVRFPLIGGRKSNLTGLLAHAFLELPEYSKRDCWPGQIRLVNLGAIEDDARQASQLKSFLPPDLYDFVRIISTKGVLPSSWCWLQFLDDGREPQKYWQRLIIWDATVRPTRHAPSPIIIGRDSSSDLWDTLQIPQRRVSRAAGHARERAFNLPLSAPDFEQHLQPSIITSFETNKPRRAIRKALTGKPFALELYVAMHTQTARWLRDLRRAKIPGLPDPNCDSLTAVAAIHRHANHKIRELAARVVRTPKAMQVVALASFFPEIISNKNVRTARHAIGFLLQLATELRHAGHHKCNVVEIVCGSLISGIWPAKNLDTNKPTFIANRLSDAEATQRLLKALEEVAVIPEKHQEQPIILALELEPGPMYVLRDWNTLCNLCQQISTNEELRTRVGINLDIAHFRLAGITPELVWSDPVVRKRIVHCHISGHHHAGHFGDLALLDLNSPNEFAPWIELVRGIATEKRDPTLYPPFHEFVSLELEAVKNMSDVHRAMGQLKALLKAQPITT